MQKPLTAAVILKKDNKVFLSIRKEGISHPNCYQSPGGKVEDGEIVLHAAQREIREETKLEIGLDRIKFLGFSRDEGVMRGYMYLVELEEGEIPSNTEPNKHTDWELYSLEEIKKLPLIWDTIKYIHLVLSSTPIWSDEQVKSLQETQDCGMYHPYTCGTRSTTLTPTIYGWVCQCCDYTQNWSH